MPSFRPQVQRFLMSELTIDPAALLADYMKPVLIVQGARDIQVAVQDAELLQRANPQAEMALIADTNHVLKTVRTADLHENSLLIRTRICHWRTVSWRQYRRSCTHRQ